MARQQPAPAAILPRIGVTRPDSGLRIPGHYVWCSSVIQAEGAWHMFSHDGTTLWAKDTQSDQARGDVGIADLDGDGYLEIAAGTTSGRTVEVMDRHGNFVWTFPDPPTTGNFFWPSGTTIADVDPDIDGLEVIIGHRPWAVVFAFDGDNSDGVDDGFTVVNTDFWLGTEGSDWDVLWVYPFPRSEGEEIEIYATGAMGDIDADGDQEIVIGAAPAVRGVAIHKGRLDHTIDRRNGYACYFRSFSDARRIPANVEILFQKPVYAVKRADLFRTGNDQMSAHGPDQTALQTKRLSRQSNAEPFSDLAETQHDHRRLDGAHRDTIATGIAI